ncbi:hypothetical protein A2U01_0086699 [Trifolium medium]|uniref:Uncharacterized protein n=1 Tax=Trifolium medium TaxID=97028 RepID=A0A392TWB4_9FABA|nr:hypothetical protein [Trifolium medium]
MFKTRKQGTCSRQARWASVAARELALSRCSQEATDFSWLSVAFSRSATMIAQHFAILDF